jgi:hypothetical protein
MRLPERGRQQSVLGNRSILALFTAEVISNLVREHTVSSPASLTSRPPERLRGHVMTAAATAEWVVQPLGYAVTGPVLGTLGLGGTYAFCAAGLSVAMLTLTIVLRQATGSVAPTANAADGGGVSRS